MTNGRKDGSANQPSQLYTYINKGLKTQSLIDYIILSTDLYAHVTSQCNTEIHNSVVKTNHALTYITIKDTRKPTCRGPARQVKLKRKRRNHAPPAPQLVFEKYQLQMHADVRKRYKDASSSALAEWSNRELPKLLKKAHTSPQEAVDEAAAEMAEAIYGAARATLPTREGEKRHSTRGKYPSKPRYWNQQLKTLEAEVKDARQEYANAMYYSQDDPTT
jgi:hypothetical protein